MFLHLLPVLLPLLLAAQCFLLLRRRRRAALGDLPSPFKLPVIGNLHQLGPIPHRSLRDMSRKQGPVMLLHFGSTPVVVVSSAEAAQEVMKDKDIAFASRPSTRASMEMFYSCSDVALAPYGEHWRQSRKLCSVYLLSGKRVLSYGGVRAEEAAAMVEKVAAWPASAGPVNMRRVVSSYTDEVISRVLVGKKYYPQHEGDHEGKRNAFYEAMEEVSGLLGTFHAEDCFPWLGWLDAAMGVREKMRRCFRRMDAFVQKVVEEHHGGKRGGGGGAKKKDTVGGDLLDMLVSLQGDQDAAVPLSWDRMKAVILDMFAGGSDTSFITLEWAMAELVRNPAAMEKAQAEVRGAAKSESAVTEDELNQMPYLEAVIQEVLRLHPPVPLLPRLTMASDVLLGRYEIPASTRVLVNAWAICRDPDYWEAPEEFRPDRFVGSSVDFRGLDFRYIPFGAGRRICPAITFAVASVKLALANLLHRFDWELPNGMRPEDLDMSETTGLTSRRKSSLLLAAVPRSP